MTSLPTLLGTPITHRRQGTSAEARSQGAANIQKDMAREILGEIVGPMPAQLFLDTFLPSKARTRRVKKSVFDSVPTTASRDCIQAWADERKAKWTGSYDTDTVKESDMYEPLVKIMAQYMPKFVTVNTSTNSDHMADENKKWRPDIMSYKQGEVPIEELQSNWRTQMDKCALAHKVKTKREPKAFNDEAKRFTSEPNKAAKVFLPDGEKEVLIRGQLATALTEIFNRQHRTHFFMTLIHDPDVRFIRCDRAGLIVTEAINFRTDPELFIEFLIRFNHLVDEEQGLDTTVAIAGQSQWSHVREELKRWMPRKSRAVTRIIVPDPSTGSERAVLAWGAIREAESLTGRCTRAYPVFDMKDNKVRFLKDTWRTDAEGMEIESALIRELQEAGVPHIPKLVAGDDVCWDSTSEIQATRTQDFIDESWVCSAPANLNRRVHHRLLEDFIPTSLSDCKSPKEMMKAVVDALLAHEMAYRHGILHRDVSDNNILIDADGNGVLADWELSIRLNVNEADEEDSTSPRQGYRTGTWAFIAAQLLKNVGVLHILRHDLESFFWVVLYTCIRRLVFEFHRLRPPPPRYSAAYILSDIFHSSTWNAEECHYTGGVSKSNMFLDGDHYMMLLRFPENEALTKWYRTAIDAFSDLYLNKRYHEKTGVENKFQDHTFLRSTFTNALTSEQWTQSFHSSPSADVKAAKHPHHLPRPSDSGSDDSDYRPGKGAKGPNPNKTRSSTRVKDKMVSAQE